MNKAYAIESEMESELWDWWAEAGVGFTIWTHPNGQRSRITASLNGCAVSEMVEHGDPRDWRLSMTQFLRRLRQKTDQSGERPVTTINAPT